MRLGLLSDTHGRYELTRTAVDLLIRHKAERLLHLGDLGSPRILDLLTGVPAAFVWGNSDYDRPLLQACARALGLDCYGAFGRLTFDKQVVCILHGDDEALTNRLIEKQECDLLFHGHTHQYGFKDIGRTRVINPGALHRADPKTVALVDTETRKVEFFTIDS